MSSHDSSQGRLAERQDRAIEVLTRCYADEYLDTDEFEEKLDQVNSATSIRRLDQVLAELPSEYQLPALRATRRSSPAAAPYSITTIMADRSCGFELVDTRNATNFTLMGTTIFDLRHLDIPPGEIQLNVTCIMGDVKLLLPPNVAVDNRVNTILADCKVKGAASSSANTRLTLNGTAVLADIKVKYR